MYSDSIKKRQQELLGVLFKKASGRFGFEEAEGADVSNDPDLDRLNKLINGATRLPTRSAKQKKSPILKLDELKIPQPETGRFDTPWFPVVGNRPIQSVDDILTDLPEVGTPNPFEAERTQITESENPQAAKLNWSDIKNVAGKQLRKMTGLDAIRGMYNNARDGVSSAITNVRQNPATPAGPQSESTSSGTPDTPTDTTTDGEGTATPEAPTTPEGGEPKKEPRALKDAKELAEQAKKTAQPPAVRPELDWNKVLKGLIEKLKRHKMVGIGGLGGFGLGALIGLSLIHI